MVFSQYTRLTHDLFLGHTIAVVYDPVSWVAFFTLDATLTADMVLGREVLAKLANLYAVGWCMSMRISNGVVLYSVMSSGSIYTGTLYPQDLGYVYKEL